MSILVIYTESEKLEQQRQHNLKVAEKERASIESLKQRLITMEGAVPQLEARRKELLQQSQEAVHARQTLLLSPGISAKNRMAAIDAAERIRLELAAVQDALSAGTLPKLRYEIAKAEHAVAQADRCAAACHLRQIRQEADRRARCQPGDHEYMVYQRDRESREYLAEQGIHALEARHRALLAIEQTAEVRLPNLSTNS